MAPTPGEVASLSQKGFWVSGLGPKSPNPCGPHRSVGFSWYRAFPNPFQIISPHKLHLGSGGLRNASGEGLRLCEVYEELTSVQLHCALSVLTWGRGSAGWGVIWAPILERNHKTGALNHPQNPKFSPAKTFREVSVFSGSGHFVWDWGPFCSFHISSQRLRPKSICCWEIPLTLP